MAETYSSDSGKTALTAATAKTMVEVSTSSTVTIRIVEIAVSCDSVATGTLLAELIAGTSGTGTSYTPKKVNGQAQNRAANFTSKINDSVEPSSVTVLRTLFVVPLPIGNLDLMRPLDREIYVPVSSMYAIRLTASVACNGAVTVEVEE